MAGKALVVASTLLFYSIFPLHVFAHEDAHFNNQDSYLDFTMPDWNEDVGAGMDSIRSLGCQRANSDQTEEVDQGNKKASKFLSLYTKQTSSSRWCKEIMRPNPSSGSTFKCTYGSDQPHQLIHPNESTWGNAIKAVQLVQILENQGIRPCEIYNWWRPEPYNANVGGAAGRHPFGTAVDVRFCSMNDMEKAFKQLCQWRREGRVRSVGYYGSTGLHLGIADKSANTWGKSCD